MKYAVIKIISFVIYMIVWVSTALLLTYFDVSNLAFMLAGSIMGSTYLYVLVSNEKED